MQAAGSATHPTSQLPECPPPAQSPPASLCRRDLGGTEPGMLPGSPTHPTFLTSPCAPEAHALVIFKRFP